MELNTNFSYKEIKLFYDGENDARLKERLFIILNTFKSKKKSSYEIAGNVLTSHTKVQRWIRRFNKYGVDGLKNKPKSGRPSHLNNEHKIKLQ